MTWKQDTTTITTADTGFNVGDVTLTGNTASAVLTVLKASDTDTTYTCLVTSTEWSITDEVNPVSLNVYGKNLYKPSSAESFMNLVLKTKFREMRNT